MSINNLTQNRATEPPISFSEYKEIRSAIALKKLQTDIAKKLNERISFSSVFHGFGGRKVALENLRDQLSSGTLSKDALENTSLPEDTRKLLKDYIDLCDSHFTEDDFSRLKKYNEDNKTTTLLGSGGSGDVYSAELDGKRFALKVLKDSSDSPDIRANESLLESLRKFGKNALYRNDDISPKGLVPYFGYYQYADPNEIDGQKKVLVFARVQGTELGKCEKIAPDQLCRYFEQAALTYAYFHELGTIVADIKPENMFVDGDELKIIDLETLIFLTEDKPKFISQTEEYAAPEAFNGRKVQGFATSRDVFSFGLSLALALTKEVKNDNGKNGEDSDKVRLEKYCETIISKARPNDFDITVGGDLNGEKVLGVKAFIESLNSLGTPEERNFYGSLLEDCLKYKPEDRISMSQIARLFRIFNEYLVQKSSNPDAQCPNYAGTKGKVIEDRPKEIPSALRDLFSDPEKREIAKENIKSFVKIDPSYKNTASYGFIAFLEGTDSFKNWAEECPEGLKQLKKQIYIEGQIPPKGMNIPVSKENYQLILETESQPKNAN